MIKLLRRVLACARNPLPRAAATEHNKRYYKATAVMFERMVECFHDTPHESGFGQGDVMIHLKSENVYRILMDPRCGLTLEETDEPAYSYINVDPSKCRKIWNRRASEVEDGRFVVLRSATGEDPWPAWSKGMEDTVAWRK